MVVQNTKYVLYAKSIFLGAVRVRAWVVTVVVVVAAQRWRLRLCTSCISLDVFKRFTRDASDVSVYAVSPAVSSNLF